MWIYQLNNRYLIPKTMWLTIFVVEDRLNRPPKIFVFLVVPFTSCIKHLQCKRRICRGIMSHHSAGRTFTHYLSVKADRCELIKIVTSARFSPVHSFKNCESARQPASLSRKARPMSDPVGHALHFFVSTNMTAVLTSAFFNCWHYRHINKKKTLRLNC